MKLDLKLNIININKKHTNHSIQKAMECILITKYQL